MAARSKLAFRLLGVSGSLRHGSVSTAVLRAARDRLPPNVDMSIASLERLPLYNEDDTRQETLGAVEEFREAIACADGLIVISPEYNHGITGVLRNAIDWVSRPSYQSVLRTKPVLVMSTSESPLGGARAQMHLRELFASTLCRVVAGRQVVIGEARKKVTAGKFTDESNLSFIAGAIDELLDEIVVTRMVLAGRDCPHHSPGENLLESWSQ